MILTCPACNTRYQVEDAQFPARGRTVRCAKCGHSWHQDGPMPEPEPAATPEPALPSAAGPEPAAPLQSAPAVAFGLPRSDPPKSEALQTAAVAAGWIGLIAVVLLIGYSAVRYRQEIAAVWPQSAGLYSGLGFAVSATGIDFRDVTYKRETEDGQPVLSVTGAIVNMGKRELAVPQTVRVTLSDGDNRELYHWSFKPAAESLKAGAAIPFRTRLSSPPAAARHLEVRFAPEGS